MSGFNPFRYRFPYTNINDINLDWLIKKVRKLSEDVSEINPERVEEVAQQAAAAEQTAQNALDTAEGVSGIATDAETIARAAQTTANNAADSAQAAGTAAAAAQTTANQNRVAIAIVANGNAAPQNISKGQFVIWYGGLYIASAAIASGATLSSSNLTAVTGGGLNALTNMFGVKSLSDLGLTTPTTIRDIVNALPYGCSFVISLSTGQVSDADFTGELYIRTPASSNVIHKTDLVLRVNTGGTTSLNNSYILGMLPGTGNAKWYVPSLTERQ